MNQLIISSISAVKEKNYDITLSVKVVLDDTVSVEEFRTFLKTAKGLILQDPDRNKPRTVEFSASLELVREVWLRTGYSVVYDTEGYFVTILHNLKKVNQSPFKKASDDQSVFTEEEQFVITKVKRFLS